MPRIAVGEENSGTIELYYEDYGSGRPVVLSHGWPLSGVAWEKQIPVLLDAGYRVIAHDRRGFGKSSKPASGYDYDTFARDLNALMTALDLRDAGLVGHSMGSAEIFHYTAVYGSDRVSELILIGVLPPFLLKTPDNPRGVDGSVFDGIKAAIAKDRYAQLSDFLDNFYNVDVYGGDRVSDDALHASWNLGAMSSPKGYYDSVQAWLTDFRADVDLIDIPTLLIHGTEDRILPYASTAEPLNDMMDNSRLVTIDRGPHGIPWTHADLVNDELIAFLALRSAAMAT